MQHRDSEYLVLDSGHGRKLERIGPYVFERPCAQAVWQPLLSKKEWARADAVFTREPQNRWITKKNLPDVWEVQLHGLKFELNANDFGHLGIFPEHQHVWRIIEKIIRSVHEDSSTTVEILNLFAYTGGATLAAARAGAAVCHLDASKKSISWARKNAELNGLGTAPVRWIAEHVLTFLKHECRRGRRYHGIILDPPSFGRGLRNEVFKIDKHLPMILQSCKELLVEKPMFVALTCHTPSYTPVVLKYLMQDLMSRYADGSVDCGEMLLPAADNSRPVPSGAFALWQTQNHSIVGQSKRKIVETMGRRKL